MRRNAQLGRDIRRFVETAQGGACFPFLIDQPDAVTGGRIGGQRPRHVRPALVDEFTEYFLTLPWGEREISLFIGFRYDANDRFPTATREQVYSDPNPLVQAVVHEPSPRARRVDLPSRLVGHGLRFEEPSGDIRWGHKCGGEPVFYDAHEETLSAVDSLLSTGWRHLLQMDFPSGREGKPLGSWPFLDMLFHVFIRVDGGRESFRYVWG